MKLRDASGAFIGEGTKELLPNGQTQIDRIFDSLDAPATTVARAEVTSDVPVVAFATVIDEKTGDPFAVLAQKAPAASVDLVVPSTVHEDGANNARYRSDLRIFNTSAEVATVTLALYPGGATMVQENGVFPSGQSGFLELGPGTPAAAVSATSAVAGTPSFYVLATVIHNVSNDPFQVTPSVQAAAPSGSCVRPTLVAAPTTETWIDLGSALAVRQMDVTSSGTQTIEATTLR